jgi:hypothetical protein
MMNISDLKQEFQATELLSNNDLTQIKGGLFLDDKRRQRPGGGTTTTSPNLRNGSGFSKRQRFGVYENHVSSICTAEV